ncbi:hypothetical protein AX16_007850 [Volvariella volvacea WC 439]|nr:hypothetical protein AX16_007850 [Volvariella volvacea WC 439]
MRLILSICTLAIFTTIIFVNVSRISALKHTENTRSLEPQPLLKGSKPTHPGDAYDLKRGHILVTNSSSGNVVGYVSRRRSVYATYRYEVEERNALTVQFNLPKSATSGVGVRLSAENSDILNYSLVGLIQGRDSDSVDLGRGSWNYLYFGGTIGTKANTPPTTVSNSYSNRTNTPRAAASDVWNIDLATGSVVPQWINSDNSKPNMQLFCQGITLYASGDYQAFANRYPDPSFPIKLTFSPL